MSAAMYELYCEVMYECFERHSATTTLMSVGFYY